MIAAIRSALKLFAATGGAETGSVCMLAQPVKFRIHTAVETANMALNVRRVRLEIVV